jgi:hypothetical protein
MGNHKSTAQKDGDATYFHPNDIPNSINLNNSLGQVPIFKAFSNGNGHTNLRAAISSDVQTQHPCPLGSAEHYVSTGLVFPGILGNMDPWPTPCAAVALQRLWLLRCGSVPSRSIWNIVGGASERAFGPGNGAVIATDFVEWLQRDGFQAEHCFKSGRTCEDDFYKGLEIINSTKSQKALAVILNGEHWVTVIGSAEGRVYVLDYAGVISVPLDKFAKQVGGNGAAPSSVVVVGW